MTIYEVIDAFKKISLKQPNINSFGEGNIYDFMNADPAKKYASFFVTQGQHQETEMFDKYNLTLFYVDRLEDDEQNRLQVQSTGKEVISNVIKTFMENFDDAEYTQIIYQPFTQRFTDYCAGIFATIVIDLPKSSVCAEDY